MKLTTLLSENEQSGAHAGLCMHYINDLMDYYVEQGVDIKPFPEIEFIEDDVENATKFFATTAYYSPSDQTIVLFTNGRHPKDVVRSFSHELIHHIQNLENRLENYTTTNINEDEHLKEIEKEAYEKGNLYFRGWENSKKQK